MHEYSNGADPPVERRASAGVVSPLRPLRQESGSSAGDPLEISLVTQDDGPKTKSSCTRRTRLLWRRAGLCLLLLAIPCFIFVGVAIARAAHRNRRLNPMLEDLENAHICYDSSYGCCIAHLQNFNLTATERALLGFIYAQVIKRDHDDASEILRGAHTLVDDPNRTTYRILTEFPTAYQRSSSHASDDPQYGTETGGILRAFLWGTLRDDLWFQFEADPWCPHDIICQAFHGLDYMAYKILHRNVGPFGFSAHTDAWPLQTGKMWAHSKACPNDCSGQVV